MLKIDLTEQFEHLNHAPIVEAVIEIRTRAQVPWEESAIKEWLKNKLSQYPKVISQKEFQHELKIDVGRPPEQKFLDLGWKGLRFQSADDHNIAQFNKDGFVFSRLHPYENWEQFKNEAMRLWNHHVDLAKSAEIQRLGVRFINRLNLPAGESSLEDYLQSPPQLPGNIGLQIAGFFHHDNLLAPGYPYAINLIKTMQPPKGVGSDGGGGIILDIDVFTNTSFDQQNDVIEKHLMQMRWLKNKIFFSSIKPKILEDLR